MTATAEPAAPVRGICCPHCKGVRLHVYRTRRPCAGKVVRYRECAACGHRVVTEERQVKIGPNKGA